MEKDDRKTLSREIKIENWLINQKNADLIKENEKVIALILLLMLVLVFVILLIF